MTENNVIDLFPEVDIPMPEGPTGFSGRIGPKGHAEKPKGFNPMQMVNAVLSNARAIKVIFTLALVGLYSSIYFTIAYYSTLVPAYCALITLSYIYRKLKNKLTKKNKSHGK